MAVGERLVEVEMAGGRRCARRDAAVSVIARWECGLLSMAGMVILRSLVSGLGVVGREMSALLA